ncbi:protein transport protein SEC31 [Plasmodium gonderi]|uniref:Protein transport protein SEC31 n=1 Tax=Plasmodium gonderi TaxID=77519 RepID=A0A1Y1JCQ4_PLAGO|nr:protein transport protein SEC31 [Plasmodium gonderi]GAW79468.1 protein transport protein SEC31 [Plasmodium gonderi]
MALKSINLSGNFNWCPFEEYKNYLICFNSHNLLYSNNNNLNNYVYLLDINLNNDIRNLEIVSKLNFEEALKNEQSGKKKNTNEYVTCFEWINCHNFVETENEDELNKGIIVGGLTNGDIILLNAQNLFDEKASYENFILSKVNVHEDSINCLEFNKHKNHLIATGGNDGQLFITDIENICSPTSYDPYLEKNNLQKITCLNWNQKVSHILATSSNNGNTIIWDLKIKKSAVSFRDPHNRTRTSSLAWLANQPTQILVSYDDDKSPCLQLWDLRNSNYPIKEIIGHSKGINNISFSNLDTNLLLSSGKDITKCWFFSNNNFDVYNEVNNSANNIYSKWSPFIPDIFASATNMDTIQINSINNGIKMTTKYIPSFYKKDSGISFGFGGKICYFDNTTVGTNTGRNSVTSNEINKQNVVGKEENYSTPTTTVHGNDVNTMRSNSGNMENKFLIKCHTYSTEMELISEADNFEKYITNGNYFEFCENKIAKTEDDHEKLTWRILQLLCTSQKSEIVKYLGYDMNNILQKISNDTGKQPGFIFNQFIEEEKENIITTNDSGNMLGANILCDVRSYEHMNNGFMNGAQIADTNMVTASGPGGGGISLQIGEHNCQSFNTAFDVDPEKFFRELGEKKENEEITNEDGKKQQKGEKDSKDNKSGTDSKDAKSGTDSKDAKSGTDSKDAKNGTDSTSKGKEKGKKKGKEKGKKKGKGGNDEGDDEEDEEDGGDGKNGLCNVKEKDDQTLMSNENNQNNDNINWDYGIESIIKECVLVGNIETAVELCLHKNRMADALFLSSFGGEQLWHKTKTIYIKKQNNSFIRNINYILDDKLDLLVKQIDLSHWGEALSILCTYGINNDNFNILCETLAKRLQNEKFDIRAASICYLCASNFDQTVEIWSDMPSTKNSLLSVLQDLVEKMTVLKMAVKYDMCNLIMNKKINQYAELLANSGRLKAAMTFLCLIQDDQTEESLILRDRIFNSATHVLSHQVKPPASPFQVFHVKSAGIMLHQNYQSYNKNAQFKPNPMSSNINTNQSKLYTPNKSTSSMIIPPPMPMQQQLPIQPPNSTHLGYASISSNKLNTQGGISSPPLPNRASFTSTSNKNFPMSNNTNAIKPPSMSTISSSYMPPPPPAPATGTSTCPIGTSSSMYSSMSNFVSLGPSQGIKLEQGCQKQTTTGGGGVGPPPLAPQAGSGVGAGPMFSSQSYANLRKLQPGGNNNSINETSPPPSGPNQINNRASFPNIQNIVPPPRNRNTSILSNANNNMSFNPDTNNQNFFKRECMDQQSFGNTVTLPPPMQSRNLSTSFQDSTSKIGFSAHTSGPPSTGSFIYKKAPSHLCISTTSPIAGALSVTPGMPVPWPIPTTTQQLGSTTTSTANENKKIQTATKEQNGVLMSRSNIENVKKTINGLLHAYIAQEPVKKKSEDISVKVHELFEKLDNGLFNEQINDSIIHLVNSLNANDFRTTNKIIVDLSRNLWDGSNKSWIMGLKCIIPKC